MRLNLYTFRIRLHNGVMLFGKEPRIYLDYAAATPLRPQVEKKMAPYLAEDFGNASSIHAEGRAAREAVAGARHTVAELVKVREDEVCFLSGGTEANNVAIQGLIRAVLASGRPSTECEILTTALEHPSVAELMPAFASLGITIRVVPVDEQGLIMHAEFLKLLSPRTILVTFAYADSELGVVQDVKRITHAVRAHRKRWATAFPYVHLDACQAPLYLPVAVDSLGVDLMSCDAGKFYGPKGVGVLVQKVGTPLAPLFVGGGQERDLRPGTENTALIVGCAEALRIAVTEREERVAHVSGIQKYAFDVIERSLPRVIMNGSQTERIANNINFSVPGIDGTYMVVTLDSKGVAASTKSACSGASGTGSKAVYALGGDDARALSTLRLTLGESSKKSDIDRVVEILAPHIEMMQARLDQVEKK